ncbi:hypothetical protein BOTCAL_0188g00100 [Botryotinia calthae]|uniref:Uncharacterized protein n=1 Tax=Botryotinia calthae TaxID=38488 RepID=A0A4Y8D012_9HELO|nr:hypothetical protein BOTCAL_0188g00100 [Botryotinia calthae]
MSLHTFLEKANRDHYISDLAIGTLENAGITCGEDNLGADCRSLPFATELLMSSTSRLLSYDNPPRYRKRGAQVTSGTCQVQPPTQAQTSAGELSDGGMLPNDRGY